MNKDRTIRFLWISMWATLILMVILKLTFNYYYPIVIENSKLLEISKYIDEHKWIDASISYIFYIINAIFISLCCLQEKWFKNKRDFIIILIAYTLAYPIKITYLYLGSIIILIPYIIIPLFLSKKPKKWIFIMFILDVIFQVLSNFARGNNIIIDDTCIIKKAMLLDYYLMFIIYYIGGCHMGWDTVLPFFTKKETVINAKIEKLQKKISKLESKKRCLKKQ